MPPKCERCDTDLGSTDGILSRLFSSAEGLECGECGSTMCQECYNERMRELLTTGAHKSCPVCEHGRLEPR